MSKLVAIANSKGGVGKSTFAVSIAEASTFLGKKVLLLDFDLQINTSLTLAGDRHVDMMPWRQNFSIEGYLQARWDRHPQNALNFVSQSNTVDWISGSPSIAMFERRLLVASTTVFEALISISAWLNDLLRDARANYDLIVCDTPPALSMMAEVVLKAADLIVVPQVPDRLSTQGLQRFAEYMVKDLELANVGSRTAVFINMMDSYTITARDYNAAIRRGATAERFPHRVFKNEYAHRVGFKEAMDQPRTYSFEQIWNRVEDQVLAATRELWDMLDAQNSRSSS
jgi:chromosome partitioning protein